MTATYGYRRTHSVAITSGKGGVGKTTLTANIAYALARQGKRVLILDGDLGMANVDLLFGIKAESHLLDVIEGEKSIQDILVPLDPNIDLISGGSGIVELSRLNPFQRRNLIDSVSSLNSAYDFLLIDTAPGLSDNVLYLNTSADLSAVVITPDVASLADSYALIKVLHNEYRENNFSIICNQVRDEADGISLFNRFSEVVTRFLPVGVDYLGAIPGDTAFRRSTQNQRLVLKHDSQTAAAHSIITLSTRIQKSVQGLDKKTGLQFFFEQVVGVA